MAIKPLNLGLKSNPARHSQGGDARLTNVYAEPQGEEGKASHILYPIEGLTAFADSGLTEGSRGSIKTEVDAYFATGGKLLRMTRFGSVETVGAIPSSGPVSFARNRQGQVVLVATGDVYVIEQGQMRLLPEFSQLKPIGVTWCVGHFVFPLSNGEFFYSGLDSVEFSSTAWYTAESNPDGLVGAATFRHEVWLFGTSTIEIWAPTGDPDNAFSRLPGAALDTGATKGSLILPVKDSLYWVDNDNVLQMARGGYSGQPIGSYALTRDLISAGDTHDLRAWSYSTLGHRFYMIQGPDFTWAWDASTGLPTHRRSAGRNRWRVGAIEEVGGKLIAGDVDNGKFYQIDADNPTEDGSPIHMIIRTPIQTSWPGRIDWRAVYLDVLTGQGNAILSGPDSAPRVTLSWSDDGGATWSRPRARNAGRMGEHNHEIQFNALGQSKRKGRMFEFGMSAHVSRAVYSARADAVGLS